MLLCSEVKGHLRTDKTPDTVQSTQTKFCIKAEYADVSKNDLCPNWLSKVVGQQMVFCHSHVKDDNNTTAVRVSKVISFLT